jgi:hypothetical protein
MIELYSPRNEGELMLLKSIFQAAGIRFFVHNDAFGSLTVGPRIDRYNQKRIFIADADYRDAQELLQEFLVKTRDGREASPRPLPVREKIRLVVEFLVFGWIVPGRRRTSPPRLRLIKGAATAPPDGADEPERRPAMPSAPRA